LLRLQVQALAAFGDLPLNVDLIVLQQLPHSLAHDVMHVRHSPLLSMPSRNFRALATQPTLFLQDEADRTRAAAEAALARQAQEEATAAAKKARAGFHFVSWLVEEL